VALPAKQNGVYGAVAETEFVIVSNGTLVASLNPAFSTMRVVTILRVRSDRQPSGAMDRRRAPSATG